MNGIIVPIIGRTSYDFSYLGSLGSETIDLATAILVAPFVSGIIVARLHVNNIPSGGSGTFDIKAFPTDPSRQDPQEFTSATADGTVTIAEPATDAAPKLMTTAVSSINGPFWKLTLTANQSATAGTALAAQISLDLVLRVNS